MVKLHRTIPQSVIILGGGIVGGSMALGLTQAGIPVTLVEQHSPDELYNPDNDGRTTALSYGSVQILKRYGAITDELLTSAQPITDIRITSYRQPRPLHYNNADIPMGYIIENHLLRRHLWQQVQAAQSPSFQLLTSTQVQTVTVTRDHVEMVTQDGQQLSAGLIIGADGRNSWLRQHLGIATRVHDYQQSAVVCNIHHELPHDGFAFEHFLPGGPLAILPMTSDHGSYRSSVVWTEATAHATSLHQAPAPTFNANLQASFGTFLGQIELCSQRWLYPLNLITVDSPIRPRVALIGDSAHAIHPIAGQGLNLGIRDLDSLAAILTHYWECGLDIGSTTMLNEYARSRLIDVKSMVLATDLLNRAFTKKWPLLDYCLGLGLNAVEHLPRLKQLLVRHAANYTNQ